jgi:predicted ATPase
MWPTGRPPHWVGRARELAVLRDSLEALRQGRGSVAWIEGEPGIGKSSLVAEAMAASDRGWDVGWGMADQLSERLPLRVMLECLQVRSSSPDPRRARAAELLRSRTQSLVGSGDATAAGLEVLVTLVDELCAATPTVLVIDDLQWADEASLVVWQQLAASIGQLRLLMVGTCRPTPRRPGVQQARAAVVRRAGVVFTLDSLSETDVAALVTAAVGAPPGDVLRRLTAQAGGNPLYVRELIDALVRDQAVQGRDGAEVALAGANLPSSLTAVLVDRLDSVSAETAQLLRAAALLGGRFVPGDLAVMLRRPVSSLAAALEEAVAAGILVGSGPELVFRHPLIRQALYEGMPLAVRTALHAEAARELAAVDADPLSVARQLSLSGRPGKGWAIEWLIQVASSLVARAPQLAVELLRRELDEIPSGSPAWGGLTTSLAWAQLAAGSFQEAVHLASWAVTVLPGPARRGGPSCTG